MTRNSKQNRWLTLMALAAFFTINAHAPARAGSLQLSDAAPGKPLTMKFKAFDGREVDLAKLQGKVVLIDFWATWCGDCRAELPNVKAAYEKLHPKGFEIIAISFDQKKRDLQSLIAKEQLPWPQYFDGLSWDNKIGKKYGIEALPAMWLIDKSGKLRDTQAQQDLAGRVEKLLAE